MLAYITGRDGTRDGTGRDSGRDGARRGGIPAFAFSHTRVTMNTGDAGDGVRSLLRAMARATRGEGAGTLSAYKCVIGHVTHAEKIQGRDRQVLRYALERDHFDDDCSDALKSGLLVEAFPIAFVKEALGTANPVFYKMNRRVATLACEAGLREALTALTRVPHHRGVAISYMRNLRQCGAYHGLPLAPAMLEMFSALHTHEYSVWMMRDFLSEILEVLSSWTREDRAALVRSMTLLVPRAATDPYAGNFYDYIEKVFTHVANKVLELDGNDATEPILAVVRDLLQQKKTELPFDLLGSDALQALRALHADGISAGREGRRRVDRSGDHCRELRSDDGCLLFSV